MKPNKIELLQLEGFRKSLGADDPARLAELESAVGHSLPEDYGEFLLEFAPSIVGGDVAFRPIELSPWAADGLQRVEVFFGLAKGTTQDIVRNYVTVADDVPEAMCPIGYDGFANRILIALNVPSGRVYFQDKDTGAVYLCANTFTGFLDSFVPLEEKGT